MSAQKSAPAGTAGADKAPAAATGNAVARRGDLVVIHLRHHEWKVGQPREYDDFWLGQVTSVTRAGLVRLYRAAGTFSWDTDGRGRPGKGQPLPSLWFEWAAIKSQKEVDVQGALATAACHTWRATRATSAATPPSRKSRRRCARTCWTSPAGNSSATPPEPGRPPGGRPARC